jgi:hypothetical protein
MRKARFTEEQIVAIIGKAGRELISPTARALAGRTCWGGRVPRKQPRKRIAATRPRPQAPVAGTKRGSTTSYSNRTEQ